MEQSFMNLAFNPLCRMNEVKRYSNVHLEEEELLSNHVAEVSAMAYIVGTWMVQEKETLDFATLLSRCLIHDVDEVVTGDIVRSTKYSSKELKRGIDNYSKSVVNKIDKSLFGIKDSYFLDDFEESKNGKEGYIVAVVDMLCVVKKSISEVTLRNNLSFLRVVKDVRNYNYETLSKCEVTMKDLGFSEKSIGLMKGILEESYKEINDIYNKNYDTLIKFDRYLPGGADGI